MSRISLRGGISAVAISLAFLSLPQAVSASTITYAVNQPINSGSATGLITTDGAIGVLTAADILSWSFHLNDGTHTGDLSSASAGNSVTVDGGALTASASNLSFNFSFGSFADFHFDGPFGTGELCYTAWSNCFGPTGLGLWDVGGMSTFDYIAVSGTQIIASRVPEPITLSLFGAGLAGAVAMRRRKKTA